MSVLLKKGRTNWRPNVFPGAVVTALGICLAATPGFAASHGDHDHDHGHEQDEEKRHAEAHEHGAAKLAMALDGGELVVEFTSPGVNIVGFEHEAKSADEKAAVEAAIEQLGSGDDLFAFDGGGCTLAEADVSAEGLLAEDHHEDEHDHGDHHDDHDEHEHEGGEAHAEFDVTYTFSCETPDELTGVSTSLFETWPGIEEIETVFLSDDHQISAELTSAQAEFEVK